VSQPSSIEPAANETIRSIHRRHSVRLFTDQPVGDEDLTALLKAANQAPSAHNQQAWRFYVLREEPKKARLAELINGRAGDFPRPSSTLLRMAARSIATASVVVGVANTGELIRHGADLFQVDRQAASDFFRTMEIQSSAAAVENLLLAATSLEIGSVWLGILFLIKREVREFLGEPDGEFMAVVALGYPARTTTGPKKRGLEAVVRYLD
jgi:nitroreductase